MNRLDKRRADLWKTLRVFESLGSSGWEELPGLLEDHQGLVRFMAGRFEQQLLLHDLRVDAQMLQKGKSSWEFYLTNLYLYSRWMPSYISSAAFELAHLCARFHFQAAEVFNADWLCMSNRDALLEKRGAERYYSDPIYMSHLWVENVAARRLFFIQSIQSVLKEVGLVIGECLILDAGSGMGGSLRLFPGVWERIGIDTSPPMVEWCNETSDKNERYELMDCRAIEYRDNTFHVVLCLDVLEHIQEPREALTEIKRITKENGVVSIVYPFGSHDWDSHISLVEKPVFDSWLEKTGYSVLAEIMAPGEVYPCSVCYLLKPT
ncbi:MAG: class I SAM-dependent methyltransferase [Acidobacteriota bacterium]